MRSSTMPESPMTTFESRAWRVGALCRAIADALQARFNPVSVEGEISGFTRASSGHCYFSLKDADGQLRCAMFRRSASLLDFPPRDGELVQVRGRLAVYEPRGDLQLVVEAMSRAGQGALFEQFLRLKARLEAEGLFDAARKRPIPRAPRRIGIVTSLGAAALHDVVTALRRRVPHIPVLVAPAPVQGASAPAELVRALRDLGQRSGHADGCDVILLVRGGGSLEDLWAFNDESLARAIIASEVPVIAGIGHETDFTIADFCADLRAPTPTAAAELVAEPRDHWLAAAERLQARLIDAAHRQLDRQQQRIDVAQSRLGRPSALVMRQQLVLSRLEQRLRLRVQARAEQTASSLAHVADRWPQALRADIARRQDRLLRAQLRLELLDPSLVLRRGYAWLTDGSGRALTSATQFSPGQPVRATLADGEVDLTVRGQG